MHVVLIDRKGFHDIIYIPKLVEVIHVAAPLRNHAHVMRCDVDMNNFYEDSFEKLTFEYSHKEKGIHYYKELVEDS